MVPDERSSKTNHLIMGLAFEARTTQKFRKLVQK